jgi:hypothetical protein
MLSSNMLLLNLILLIDVTFSTPTGCYNSCFIAHRPVGASFHFFGPYNGTMSAGRWGAAGPPLEAYSRVTNPERFASLHDSAARFLHRLEREFETERREAYGLDPELEHDCNLSRPSVALLPCDVGAAPSSLPSQIFRDSAYVLDAGTSLLSRHADVTLAMKRRRVKLNV